MSWAATRTAARTEDLAYSLLGLFGINMPIQYGECHAAFVRLQREILKTTDDKTLFAWSLSAACIDNESWEKQVHIPMETHQLVRYVMPSEANGVFEMFMPPETNSAFGRFAPSSEAFKGCQNIVFAHMYASGVHITESNGATHMKLPVIPHRGLNEWMYIGLLPCAASQNPDFIVGIWLQSWTPDTRIQRVSYNGSFTILVKSITTMAATTKELLVDNPAHVANALEHQWFQTVSQRRVILINEDAPFTLLRLIATYPPLETDFTAMTV